MSVMHLSQGHMDSLAAVETTRESDADPAALFELPVSRGEVPEDPSQTFGRSVGKVSAEAVRQRHGTQRAAGVTLLRVYLSHPLMSNSPT